MKKILNENNSENTVVHVLVKTNNGEEYECVGVLIREEETTIRIAFTAKNDQVVDYLDIKRSEIIGLDVVDPSVIEEI